MNEAHLHLVFNHFPIVGTFLAFGILIGGIITKNTSVKNTAYLVFIVATLFGILSMATGEGAEALVKDMPDIGRKIIHEHEEIAEKMALLLDAVGILSIIGLYLNWKQNNKEKWVAILILIISVVTLFVAQKVGSSGGEIRHTEIRTTS